MRSLGRTLAGAQCRSANRSAPPPQTLSQITPLAPMQPTPSDLDIYYTLAVPPFEHLHRPLATPSREQSHVRVHQWRPCTPHEPMSCPRNTQPLRCPLSVIQLAGTSPEGQLETHVQEADVRSLGRTLAGAQCRSAKNSERRQPHPSGKRALTHDPPSKTTRTIRTENFALRLPLVSSESRTIRAARSPAAPVYASRAVVVPSNSLSTHTQDNRKPWFDPALYHSSIRTSR